MEKKIKRCDWVGDDELMIDYHDKEWGMPVHDDKKLFECLVLESAQAGLNWKTILHKRNGYRKLFAGFNIEKVAKFTKKDIEQLMLDERIIRNRLKIEATINNAQRFLEIKKEFKSFSDYVYSFDNEIMLSADLKKRGFRFIGLKIIYAYMQAVGMVNDHDRNCFRYKNNKIRSQKLIA